ncbi:hypothetical protein ASZ78_003140, partial [Callipepla squamata]
EQTLALRKEGIGVVLDSELPHLIGIDDDLLSTGIILYHLKEGQTYVGREDAVTEQDIVLHGLDLESEHCIFENLNGTVNLIPLNGAQCSVNGIQITKATQLNQGAVILLGRTNMFRFNHPKEAAKLREKRKSGLLSSFSLSMTDLSKSCENLSAVMLYNPGLEFERQQREELEKLESKRKQIEEMEEKQRSDKAELVRMQQEVESQRKETEIVQLQIRKQEESLKRRSVHIESRLKDLLAEKEKFEEERLREQQEIELQKKKQQEEIFARVKEELQRLQELNHKEKAEKMQIFRELEKLKQEKDEQYIKLESEKKRLEEQEREQVMLVAHLEEQLREKQVMIQLLKRGDVQRVEEEKRDLEDIRESLLKVKEARSEGEENSEELEKAQHSFIEFKKKQLEQLTILEKDLVQQMNHLEKEIVHEKETLGCLKLAEEEHVNLKRGDEHFGDAVLKAEEFDVIKPAEYRLQSKVRQLEYLKNNHLPALLEEKQRASEVLDRGLLGLDNTLYQIEKEIEDKGEQLAQYRASTNQLQQLQETFEFTANVARQEEKVRKKEKEILESREKQQREALEQAVAKLERRHSALQRRSTIDFEIEEQKQKLATLNNSCSEQAGLQASLEAEQKALEQDRERLDQEIQQLKQKIYEGDGGQKGNHGMLEERLSHTNSPTSPTKPQPPSTPLVDDRINAYIEQEVQRRLQNIHHKAEDNDSSLLWSTESFKDNERLNNGAVQRKLKYELSPLGSLMCANEQAGFNSIPSLSFPLSNIHSEITVKESRSFKTMQQTMEDQTSSSQLPIEKASDLTSSKQEIDQSSLAVFHEVPIITIQEIHVGFAGQSVSLLCSAEDDVLTVFTYNKHYTQRICHDIMSILISTKEDAAYLDHQLLKGDLMRISLDWTSEINDIVFSRGVRLSCEFRTVLADLVYLLHENMGDIKPSLADIQVVLYTTVKTNCANQTAYRSLVLTTTHIGLLRENSAFYPAPSFLDASCKRSQFDSLQLYSLNDIRCVVLPDKENLTKIELVFSRRSRVGSDSGIGFSKEINTQMSVIPSVLQSSLHIPSEIWELTFSSSEEAIWLIMHLTRC